MIEAGLGSNIKEQKRALRRVALERRAALDPAWRAEASGKIAQRALDWIAEQGRRSVALYSSIGEETQTHDLIRELIARDVAALLPRPLRNPRRLEFHRVRVYPDDCIPGYGDILEPNPKISPEIVDIEEIDLIIVPAIVFDRRGYRLGYGGGYYDRFLATRRSIPAMGLLFSAMFADDLPLDPWDQPVDLVCTEEAMMRFPRD